MDNAAIVTQQAAPLEQVTPHKVDPELLTFAAAIYTQALSDPESGLTKAQALRAALHFKQTGEVIGRHSYVGTKGKVTGQVLEGYRGVLRQMHRDFMCKYRLPTPEEVEDHNINNGDRTLVCELYLLDTMKAAKEAGVEYIAPLGITVVRKGEKLNIPNTKTARWVLEKQARNDALRKAGLVGAEDETEGIFTSGGGLSPDVEAAMEQEAAAIRTRQAANMEAGSIPPAASAVNGGEPPSEPEGGTDTEDPYWNMLTGAEPPPSAGEEPTNTAKAAPASKPAATARATWPARPWSPEVLRSYVQDAVAKYSETITPEESEKLRRRGYMALQNIFGFSNDDNQRAAVEFLFGHTSRAKLTDAENSIIVRWVKASKDRGSGEWVPCQNALDEVKELVQYIADQAERHTTTNTTAQQTLLLAEEDEPQPNAYSLP